MSASGRTVSFPTRFRRRITLFCTAAVAVATAAFGLGSFLFIRNDKLERFEGMARRETALRVSLAAAERPATPEELAHLLADPGRAQAVVMGETSWATSAPALDPGDVPRSLLEGEAEVETSAVDGSSYLIVAAGDELPLGAFLFFDRQDVVDEVRSVGEILAMAWFLAVGMAALVCSRLARRALWPVRGAAEVARDLADGLLDARMPAEGEDEFSAWAWEFNRMVDELERRIERERRFTADVAHELRTPLASLATAASMLHGRVEQLPPAARRPAELLVQEVRRLRGLVEDLLEISRSTAGAQELEVNDIELRQRIATLVEARGWSGDVAVVGRAVRLVTDPRRFDRVILNLIGNAVRHGRPPVTVTVSTGPQEATVEIDDRGPGIAPEVLEKIFEPFYKGDPSRTGPGSGLGLAIAAEHALVLGGRISAESEIGRGSRFVLHLPLRDDEDEPRARTGS